MESFRYIEKNTDIPKNACAMCIDTKKSIKVAIPYDLTTNSR